MLICYGFIIAPLGFICLLLLAHEKNFWRIADLTAYA